LRNGVKWHKLDGEQLCDVIYTMIIDDICEMGVARVEAREQIDKRLKDELIRYNAKHGVKQEPEPFKRDPALAARLGIKLPAPARST
jgi:hypothetical protein